MAKVGLRYPIAMKISGYDETGMPIYENGIYIGKGVKADVNFDTAEGELFADDTLAEFDSCVVGYSGSLEADGFGTFRSGANETRATVLAYLTGAETVEKGTDSNFEEAYETSGEASPYCGFAYIKSEVTEGKRKWYVYHCYKTVFKMPNESDSTKTKSINFGTSSIDFTGMGIMKTGAEEPVFTKCYLCSSYEKAVALLKSIGKIQEAAE